MYRASILSTFKFDANIKQPFVLRPCQAGLGYRLILATLKAICKIPTTLFRSKLCLDCNERIAEVPFVLQNITSPVGMKILDFGCTESLLPLYFATHGAEVVGVDLRDYDFAHPNLSFHKGDFLDNNFPTASFDAVVAVSAVEHSGLSVYGSKTYERGDLSVVQEFRRILKPKGLLILTVPFGKPSVNDTQRVYDSAGLDELTSALLVLKRQFFRKAPEGTYWLMCSEEEAGRADYDPVTGVQGVALICCAKPA